MPIGLPDRKYLLMMRDPLVQKLDEKHKQLRKNCFDETLTKEVEQLKKEVKDKWNARLYWPETTLQGVKDYWLTITPPYVAVKDERANARREEHLFINKDYRITSLKCNGLVCCSPHEIPIIIDPTILTLNDEKAVKQEVWDIVKSEIGKQTIKIKGRTFAIPPKEPKELAAVFRCRPEKFEKYLRWYDLRMEEDLTFPLIALIEFHSKAEDKEQKFKEQISRKKKVRNIGHVKEEDTVRKGVGLIYQAIFRKPMSDREDHPPTLKKYNCPYHSWNPNKRDWDCDEDCEYLKNYSARLSRF